MKTLYLFDIDGTLLYSDRRDSRSFATSYQSVFGRPFPTIDWTRFPEVTDHVIFRTAFHDHFNRHASAQEQQTFEQHYVEALTHARSAEPTAFSEVPGALRYWRRLAQDPTAVLGVATGGWRRPQCVKLHHRGFPANPVYAGYADGKFSRVEILQCAIDAARGDHDISRIVYFGDAVWDALTCRKMNIPLVGVRRRGDHDVLTKLGVQQVITDYRDPAAVDRAVSAALLSTSSLKSYCR